MATKKQAETKDYVVLTPVEHDGKRYPAGATLSIGEDDAAPLLKVGAIAEPAAKDEPNQ
jgi:hypothetical protein